MNQSIHTKADFGKEATSSPRQNKSNSKEIASNSKGGASRVKMGATLHWQRKKKRKKDEGTEADANSTQKGKN